MQKTHRSIEPNSTFGEFSVAGLLARACANTGLQDFGHDSFLEPLSLLIYSLKNEARLTEAGLESQHQRILGLLENRLRVEAHYAAHPEINEERIVKPVVIVGLPRTGTTMLHRILSSDHRFYFPRFYEARYPVPLNDLGTGEDVRIARVEDELKAMLAAAPELASVHPLSATEAEEEISLIEHSFFSSSPEAFCRVPTYANWVERNDNAPGYRYLVRLLKLLQWLKRQQGQEAERWLLKTPHHLHHMQLLLDTFPDAKVLLTHRDPLETIPSLTSFHRYLYTLSSDDVDVPGMAQHWMRKFSRSIDAAVAVREKNPGKFLDIHFKDTVSDSTAVVESVYAFLGMQLEPTVKQAMATWKEENRREKRAEHKYSLGEFGFTAELLEKQFSSYRTKFINAPGI